MDAFIRKVQSAMEYEEHREVLKLISVTMDDRDVYLVFDLVDDMEPLWQKERWEICCRNHIHFSQRLMFKLYGDIDLYDQHILMWDISEDRYELHFEAKPTDTARFLGELFIAHREITKGFIPFGKHIEDGVSDGGFDYDINVDFINGQNGLFASGPEPIMTSYMQVLRRNGVGAWMVLNNLYYQKLGKSKKFKGLIFDKSYVIAQAFNARKIS